MRKVWFIIAVGLLVFLIWRGLEFAMAAGAFRTLESRPLACLSVGGVIGPEDVTIDPERGRAYISGYDRRAAAAGTPTPGAIWAYDLSNSAAVPVNLTPWADETFLPHGISLHIDEAGTRRLFVISHGDGHRIDVLEERGDLLERIARREDNALISPNDVAAVDAERFYFTNDHFFEEGSFMRTVEDFAGLPLTNVLYFDGDAFREVASGMKGANGIHLSEDGATLYVSAARGSTIHVFDRDMATGDLTPRDKLKVPGMPDNIEPGPEGSLLVALHPKPLELLGHVNDADKPAPSQIVRLDPRSGAATTLYLDLGEELSAASTGAMLGQRLLIGAIMDPKFLDCEVE